jgi:DNA-directed RNA polymerase subunit RPC12/RpoP
MDVKKVIESLNLSRVEESVEEEVEESVAGDMVDVEKVIAALVNKRGNEYVDQIEDLEVIAKQDDGVVLQVTKMSNGEAEKVGDFLTNAELDSVKVNNESEEVDEDEEINEEKKEVKCPECGKADNVKKEDDEYVCTDCDVEFEVEDAEEEEEEGEEEEEEEEEDEVNEEKDSVNENRVDRMMDFLNYVPAESLLDNVVRALSEQEAKEIFEYILRMWGDNWALDLKQEIEDSRMKRLDILDRILNGGVPAEKVLEDIVRALSEREADDVFDYVSRMMDIPESKEEKKSKAEEIIESIRKKHEEVNEADVDSFISARGNKIKITIEDDNFELYKDILEDNGYDGTLKENVNKVASSIFEGLMRDYENNASRFIEDAVKGLGSQLK